MKILDFNIYICCLLISSIFFSGCRPSQLDLQKVNPADLKLGDILFQDMDCGDPCDAIESVTKAYGNTNLSHVAIITYKKDDVIKVTEAVGDYVQTNSLDKFLERSNKVLVGRLKEEHQPKISEALDYINERILNQAYDHYYLITNDTYYCSEVIYEAFKVSNGNKPLFTLYPMTFKEPGTDQYFRYWETHYESMNERIPEGEPGLNPGSMSLEPCIDILYRFESPSLKK